MKISPLLICLMLLSSCVNNDQKVNDDVAQKNALETIEIQVPEFQVIIDSAKVRGAVLIYDLKDKTYYSNDFSWAQKGQLPASTFKITNSIIALETGVVENDSTLFKWDGKKRWLKVWEQDLIFRDAFHVSCVPCYQDIARRIGLNRMKAHLEKFNYGNVVVDSSTIDLFWLEGASTISPFEQIDFLTRFYQSKLPISKRTEAVMKNLMVIEETEQYKLSGKTGWSIRNNHNNGWFVGYLEAGNKVYFFATNVEPSEQFNMDMFAMIRKDITFKAMQQLEIVK